MPSRLKSAGALVKGASSSGSNYPAPWARDVLLDESFVDAAISTPWVIGAAGTGATVVTGSVLAGMQGIADHQTGTTATGRASLNTSQTALFLSAFPGSQWEYRARVAIPTLSTAGVDQFASIWGLGDQNAASQTDGLTFELDQGNVQLVSSNNSVRTTVDSGIAFVASSIYDTKILVAVSADGLSAVASFYIDLWVAGATPSATLRGTISTNMPLTSGRAFGLQSHALKSAGLNSRSFYLDSVQLVLNNRGGAQ